MSAVPVPGSPASTAPAVTKPQVKDEFKALALHLSEVGDSDDSERHSTSLASQKRDVSASTDVEHQLRQQEERDELERQKQEKV